MQCKNTVFKLLNKNSVNWIQRLFSWKNFVWFLLFLKQGMLGGRRLSGPCIEWISGSSSWTRQHFTCMASLVHAALRYYYLCISSWLAFRSNNLLKQYPVDLMLDVPPTNNPDLTNRKTFHCPSYKNDDQQQLIQKDFPTKLL